METRRILVIDDEDDIREVVQMTLEVFGGWHAQTARSGSEGIAAAEHWQPDAILLDMMMPELDGQSTFRLLRDGPATNAIPIIMLTAKVQTFELEALLQMGVTGVIAKPFLATELPGQIQAILGW